MFIFLLILSLKCFNLELKKVLFYDCLFSCLTFKKISFSFDKDSLINMEEKYCKINKIVLRKKEYER